MTCWVYIFRQEKKFSYLIIYFDIALVFKFALKVFSNQIGYGDLQKSNVISYLEIP